MSLKSQFQQRPTSFIPDHINKAGGSSYSHDVYHDAVSVLMTGTFSNLYYASERQVTDESLQVMDACAKADPEFFAKALVHARNEGYMRSAPVVGLAVLSVHSPKWFKRAFDKVILTPNDLQDFVRVLRSRRIRQGLGRSVKTAINSWLNSMSEYHAFKYGSLNRNPSLRDILKLTHPKPIDEKHNLMFRRLMDYDLPEGWEEKLPLFYVSDIYKKADPETRVNLIEKHSLTWEFVSSFQPSWAEWKALAPRMPYFALIRNLNNIVKYMQQAGEFDDDLINRIADRIRNEEAIRKSKLFPFRFYVALENMVPEAPQVLKDALVDALEISLDNLPDLPGKIAICPDVSGSMSGTKPFGEYSSIDCERIAALLSAALFKKSKDAIVIAWDTKVYVPVLIRRDSLFSIMRSIPRSGGGTDMTAPIRYLVDTRRKVDLFIGLTDNESWVHSWDKDFVYYWAYYKKKINPEAKALLITLAPYGDYIAPQDMPDVKFVSGFSDNVLRIVSFSPGDHVEQIRNMTI